MANYNSAYTGAQVDSGIAGGLDAVRYSAQSGKSAAQKKQARTNIGAAESELFSRNGTAALPSGYKGFDVRPFSNGISLGIGMSAPDTVNNTEVKDTLQAPLRNAIGAQATLTVANLTITSTNTTTLQIDDHGITKYGRSVTGYLSVTANQAITGWGDLSISGMPSSNNSVTFLGLSSTGTMKKFYLSGTTLYAVDALSVGESITITLSYISAA